jgi:hypothetical protein
VGIVQYGTLDQGFSMSKSTFISRCKRAQREYVKNRIAQNRKATIRRIERKATAKAVA